MNVRYFAAFIVPFICVCSARATDRYSAAETVGNQFSAELQELSRRIKANPHDCAALSRKATLLQDISSDQAAMDLINKTVAEDPKCSAAWYGRAVIYRVARNIPEAMFSINKAIELQSQNGEYWRLMTLLLQAQNKYAEAELAADSACRLMPTSELTHSTRLELSLRLKHWQKAVDDSTFLIHSFAKTRDKSMMIKEMHSYLNRANAYMGLKDYKHALADCLTAQRAWPDDVQVCSALIQVYTAMGDTKNAQLERTKLSKIEDDFRPLE